MLIPYRAVNTLRLGYKKQSLNVAEGDNRCLFPDTHTEKSHKRTVFTEFTAQFLSSCPKLRSSSEIHPISSQVRNLPINALKY
jgi:hypothetical protein